MINESRYGLNPLLGWNDDRVSVIPPTTEAIDLREAPMKSTSDDVDIRVRSIERPARRLAVQWHDVAPGDRAVLQENADMLRHPLDELDAALHCGGGVSSRRDGQHRG